MATAADVLTFPNCKLAALLLFQLTSFRDATLKVFRNYAAILLMMILTVFYSRQKKLERFKNVKNKLISWKFSGNHNRYKVLCPNLNFNLVTVIV